MINSRGDSNSMKTYNLILLLISTTMFSSCEYFHNLEAKAKKLNEFEVKAYVLAKQNRELQATIHHLEYEIENLKAEKSFLEVKLKQEKREISSIPTSPISVHADESEDVVKFKTFKWKPKQLLAFGQDEYGKKNFDKSAQFLHSLVVNYPKDKLVDDNLLLQTSVAAFQSGKRYDWTVEHLAMLMEHYPTSKHFRSAKLWTALSYFKLGQMDKFYKTVEEFRVKYRNTEEWKILKDHYEMISDKKKSIE